MANRKALIVVSLGTVLGLCAGLFYFTQSQIKPFPQSFHDVFLSDNHVQLLSRNGEPLNTTYQNRWNVHHQIPLHEVPNFLTRAFIVSEDKRFYEHSGADWLARMSALVTNVKSMRGVRGASTITEQIVRMVHPRPRNLWSRWIEGFEASTLEKQFTKDELLEFYLNQIPYAANRRGITHAAHYYFNRDLNTLSKKEMLALVVLVRAPSRLSLWKNPKKIEPSINRLAHKLADDGILPAHEKESLIQQQFVLESPSLNINASEFVRHVKRQTYLNNKPTAKTTLDGDLQNYVQKILDNRLEHLKPQKVYNGAVLAVDHKSGDILAWVVGGKNNKDTPGRFIDAVTTPRQPGSALKPFLYALALEKEWSPATVIDDTPLTESVGHGLHDYQNYSRTFYGPVTLRQALGNSLNIPALKVLQHVGAENYLKHLHNFGFQGLNQHPNFYGDGIALGNGEVTLYEMVRAYASIANHGYFRKLNVFAYKMDNLTRERVLSPEVSSLIGHILSDNQARKLEFGEGGILNFPVQTAVKTGTSSDYRDSWAIGFNHHYTVGVWMGNLDQQPTDGITGSTGPALLLRSVFSKLNQHQETRPLPIHKNLVRRDLCIKNHKVKQTSDNCKTYTEWFIPGTEPYPHVKEEKPKITLRQPVNNLHIAYDPRVPSRDQAFEFYIEGIDPTHTVTWELNGKEFTTQGGKHPWHIQKGTHTLSATVTLKGQTVAKIKQVGFLVK